MKTSTLVYTGGFMSAAGAGVALVHGVLFQMEGIHRHLVGYGVTMLGFGLLVLLVALAVAGFRGQV